MCFAVNKAHKKHLLSCLAAYVERVVRTTTEGLASSKASTISCRPCKGQIHDLNAEKLAVEGFAVDRN
jgi:hypothetical protein